LTSIYSSTWTCEAIENLGDKWKKCANVRKARENKCFRGGDPTHKFEINKAEYQYAYSRYLLKYLQCPGYWTPPPPSLNLA
jgi:Novel toxin 16